MPLFREKYLPFTSSYCIIDLCSFLWFCNKIVAIGGAGKVVLELISQQINIYKFCKLIIIKVLWFNSFLTSES